MMIFVTPTNPLTEDQIMIIYQKLCVNLSKLHEKKRDGPDSDEIEENSSKKQKGPSGHWSMGLNSYIERPEAFPVDVVFYDDEIVIIHDKFPKVRSVLMF
jgi:hypothetical protein